MSGMHSPECACARCTAPECLLCGHDAAPGHTLCEFHLTHCAEHNEPLLNDGHNTCESCALAAMDLLIAARGDADVAHQLERDALHALRTLVARGAVAS